MTRHEARYQIVFSHYLKSLWTLGSAVFELKQTQGKSIPFSDVKEHQIRALYNTKNSFLYYKIPDDSIGEKPFDCMYLTDIPAYVILFFKRTFYVIKVDDFMNEKRTSSRKSITEEMAKNIALSVQPF